MGEVIEVEFDAAKRFSQALSDPLLQLYHEWRLDREDVLTSSALHMAELLEGYSDEGMIEDLSGHYHLSPEDARLAFEGVRAAVQRRQQVSKLNIK